MSIWRVILSILFPPLAAYDRGCGSIVIMFLSITGFSQLAAKELSPKIGVYAYQNVGLKGGVGVRLFPFKQHKQLGFSAGYSYYSGDLDSRFNDVIDQYKGFDIGVSTLKSIYHNRSGGKKKAYRGLEINAFYSTNGNTSRSKWYQIVECNGTSGPSVSSAASSSSVGVEVYGKFARGFENSKSLVLLSFMPGLRYIKSESSYSVMCDPSLIDESHPNKSVANVSIPITIKLQLAVYLKHTK
jgi:hypothetical protein|tara:strand:+ start:143 stop:868 length:726 start_codon:yes stop_codon:yes gene_type:complete